MVIMFPFNTINEIQKSFRYYLNYFRRFRKKAEIWYSNDNDLDINDYTKTVIQEQMKEIELKIENI